MKKSGVWKSWCAPIYLKIPCSCSRAQKIHDIDISFTDSTIRSYTSSWNLNRSSDVESIFLTLERLHGGFNDIGAHQDFQTPDFFMPELLLKELWDIANRNIVFVLLEKWMKLVWKRTKLYEILRIYTNIALKIKISLDIQLEINITFLF